jgi:hydrogenase nickel incorporation protein HypA/HybF
MHELAITQEIVDIVCARAAGARIRRIVVEIGKLSAVLPDAVRFCFDLCSENTPAEGALLDIIETPGRGRCRQCQADVVMQAAFSRCHCGSTDLDWLSGEELKIKEMEVI